MSRLATLGVFVVIAGCCFGVPVVAEGQPTTKRGTTKPNVILFVVDDTGWQDTSVEFHASRTAWNLPFDLVNQQAPHVADPPA